MDFLHMDQAELIKLIIMIIVGGAGWAFALGRRVITSKVIEEASAIFVKRDIHDLEIKNMQTSIIDVQREQKSNHADLVARLDKAVEQINKKVEMLMQ